MRWLEAKSWFGEMRWLRVPQADILVVVSIQSEDDEHDCSTTQTLFLSVTLVGFITCQYTQ